MQIEPRTSHRERISSDSLRAPAKLMINSEKQRERRASSGAPHETRATTTTAIPAINLRRREVAIPRNWCNLTAKVAAFATTSLQETVRRRRVSWWGGKCRAGAKGRRRVGRGPEGGRENLSGLPHSGTDLQGCRCFTTPQSAARSR